MKKRMDKKKSEILLEGIDYSFFCFYIWTTLKVTMDRRVTASWPGPSLITVKSRFEEGKNSL